MPQRPPSRRQLQAERKARLDALRAAQHRKARRSTFLVIGGSVLVGVVVLALVGVSIANRHSGSSSSKLEALSVSPPGVTGTAIKASPGTVDTSRKSAISGVAFYAGLAHTHVTTPVTYAQTPPVGGPHNPVWLNCGTYNDPVPQEYAVYDLEHGAVWITYQPTLAAADVNALVKLAKSFGSYVTVTPYRGLASKVVASAWGVQLKLDSANDPRLKAFVTTYRNGKQAPEPGGACTGGIGEPRGTVTNASDVSASPSAVASAAASPSFAASAGSGVATLAPTGTAAATGPASPAAATPAPSAATTP